MKERVKFSTQADPEILSAIKLVAEEEGRQLQVVLEEAMIYYLDNRKHRKVRASVMAHYHDTVSRNHHLFELLAK